jgi:hypothetical protein
MISNINIHNVESITIEPPIESPSKSGYWWQNLVVNTSDDSIVTVVLFSNHELDVIVEEAKP